MTNRVASPRGKQICPARLNPFAVARTDGLAFRFPATTWEAEWSRLVAMGWRATICGPHGTGKTTLLEQLQPRLQRCGRVCWLTRPPLNRREQSRFLDRCFDQPASTILLVDSAEQLSCWNWWRLVRESARRNQGLVATVHRPSRLLPTWVRTQTTPDLFLELLAELVPLGDENWKTAALNSYQGHRGNIRNAFRELYDRYPFQSTTATTKSVPAGQALSCKFISAGSRARPRFGS